MHLMNTIQKFTSNVQSVPPPVSRHLLTRRTVFSKTVFSIARSTFWMYSVMISDWNCLKYCIFACFLSPCITNRMLRKICRWIIVTKGLGGGIILSIVSEILFFVSFVWAFFHTRLSPSCAVLTDLLSIIPTVGISFFNWSHPNVLY